MLKHIYMFLDIAPQDSPKLMFRLQTRLSGGVTIFNWTVSLEKINLLRV